MARITMATARALPKRREERGISYWISRESGGIEERLIGPFNGRFGLRAAERKLAQLQAQIEAARQDGAVLLADLVITGEVHPQTPACPLYHARAIQGAAPLPAREASESEIFASECAAIANAKNLRILRRLAENQAKRAREKEERAQLAKLLAKYGQP